MRGVTFSTRGRELSSPPSESISYLAEIVSGGGGNISAGGRLYKGAIPFRVTGMYYGGEQYLFSRIGPNSVEQFDQGHSTSKTIIVSIRLRNKLLTFQFLCFASLHELATLRPCYGTSRGRGGLPYFHLGYILSM